MRAERVRLAAAIAVCGSLLQIASAEGARIRVLCSNGLRAVMLELVPEFERAAHHTVSIDFAPAAVLKQRIDAGEPFDVAVLTPATIDEAIRSGRMTAGSRAVIAQSPLGIAMRAGAAKPAMDTVDALTRTLRASRTITYAAQGASAAPFEAIVERLGLSAEIRPKLRLRDTGVQVPKRSLRAPWSSASSPSVRFFPRRASASRACSRRRCSALC